MTERIILIAFVGGPLDGETEELKWSGEPPDRVKRARRGLLSFRNVAQTEAESVLSPQGIHEYQMRGGPGLVGRAAGGAWIYDYKGET